MASFRAKDAAWPRRWLYRSQQFFAAWRSVREEDELEARQVLGPKLYPIYAAMPRQYRLHSVQVYKRVREAGCADPQVWQAAFLHDSGKYDPITRRSVTILHRVAIVLLKATPPGRALWERLAARRNPAGIAGYLLYPFYLSQHHARLGAMLARKRGASQEVVRLIAEHHKPAQGDPALSALQAADDQS